VNMTQGLPGPFVFNGTLIGPQLLILITRFVASLHPYQSLIVGVKPWSEGSAQVVQLLHGALSIGSHLRRWMQYPRRSPITSSPQLIRAFEAQSQKLTLRCRFRSKVSTLHRDAHWSVRLTDGVPG